MPRTPTRLVARLESPAVDDLQRDMVLGQLAAETTERLGFRLPADAVLRINREAYSLAVAHGLNSGGDFTAVADALETASKHIADTEERWSRYGSPTEGWWWEKLAAAYEMYWDAVNKSTGFFIDLLERNGVELPRLEEAGG
jgi:hypothetical protein